MMLKLTVLIIALVPVFVLAQQIAPKVTFNDLIPLQLHEQMGVNKLTETEKAALGQHIWGLINDAYKQGQASIPSQTTMPGGNGSASSKVYAGVGGGHWVKKNIDSGTMMVLEDGSLWKVDPYNKIDAMLWLPISSITIMESSEGSLGYNYLLINTDDGEQAHAKYIGRE